MKINGGTFKINSSKIAQNFIW